MKRVLKVVETRAFRDRPTNGSRVHGAWIQGVRVAAWRVAVSGVLGDDFECVAEDGLVGVALFVFVRKGGERDRVVATHTHTHTREDAN